MNTGTGGIEVASRKRVVWRNFVAEFLRKIVGHVSYGGGIYAVFMTHETNIFNNEPLYRGVAGTLTKSQKSAVGGRTAIEPGCGGIYEHLMEIIMSMPLEKVSRHSGIIYHRSNQFGNASRQGCTRIGDTKTKGVTETDFDINPALFPQLHELNGKRHTETVDVSPGYIFEVATGRNAFFQCGSDNSQIFLHDFSPATFELKEDMVVGDRGENAGFFKAHVEY